MSCPITTESVVAYSHCPRKAYFLLRGEPRGCQHEYEQILSERTAANRYNYLTALPSADMDIFHEMTCKDSLGVIRANDLVATCDAIVKKMPETGKRHARLEPHLAVGTHDISKEQKVALAYAGYVLGQKKRYVPANGIVVPFGGTPKRVRLQPFYPGIRATVASLRKFVSEPSSKPPTLTLIKSCHTCHFHDYCRHEAEDADNLTLLARMTPKLVKRYAKKGIFTVNQLSYLFKPRRRRRRANAAPPSFSVELQALAIRTNKIYLHQIPSLEKKAVELYLDVEGIPDEDFHYLIGLLVQRSDAIEMHSFWADTAEDEAIIFEECVKVANRFPSARIYHYGSYEPRAFQKAATQHGIDCTTLVERLVNVNSLIFGKVYFPTKSNRLKDLGAFVGASWSTPDPSGVRSLSWRYRWEVAHSSKFKDMLLSYNHEDCEALRLLTKELQNLAEVGTARSDVDFADRPKLDSTSAGEEIHCAFENILGSAHEYRRKSIRRGPTSDRVSSSPRKRGGQKGHKANFRAPVRPGKIVRVRRSMRCPRHKGQALNPVSDIAEHTVIDLAFTKRGCRKTSVKYVGRKSHCPICHKDYAPPAIRRFGGRLFGHSFQAWAVYQRIVLRLPYRVICQVTEDLLSEHVSTGAIRKFMRNLSDRYRNTEKLIRRQILASPFVHADESKISIQGKQHYVWILTDGTHVIFYMTETRETAALRKTLRNYGGVLISDFFPGYDSMECRQQKCLVHLIRDLNDDLWKNPFNQHFESFVAEIRDLFVPIFEDIDRYGLRVRHLGKHRKAVDRFYKYVIDGKQYDCDIIQKYQKRFARYRDSLFVFLTESGIPWNNNMAERGLRHFAVQRKISGSFFKSGANDYFRLLGIAQTCRFQDKPFLQFLLSGELDVDRFRARKRRR